MTKRFFYVPKKWTAAIGNVHCSGHLDGQGGCAQVVDSLRKTECPFANNLGVNIEGTLPGKAKG